MTTNFYTTDFFKNLINHTPSKEDNARLVKIDNDIQAKRAKESPSLLEFIFSAQA